MENTDKHLVGKFESSTAISSLDDSFSGSFSQSSLDTAANALLSTDHESITTDHDIHTDIPEERLSTKVRLFEMVIGLCSF